MAAVMVQDGLDVVGLYAKLAELRCTGSTKIVQAPECDAQALVELVTIPVCETTLSKEEVGGVAPGHPLKNGKGLRREWDFMRAGVLGALRG